MPPARRAKVKVIRSFPHRRTAFTQGLEFDGDHLYESTGEYGRSTFAEINPATGEALSEVPLADKYFGEGLTVVERDGAKHAIILTWREQTAFVFDLDGLGAAGTHTYSGEGWGLCHDDQRLVMSNGSATLTFRDPDSFAAVGSVDVTLDGEPLPELNELECVDGAVYANVWQTNDIVRIDPKTGRVTDLFDASGLLSASESAGADVLNGIAYHQVSEHFLITGKHWPKMFEVEMRPGPAVVPTPDPAPTTPPEPSSCSSTDPQAWAVGLLLIFVRWRRHRG